MTTVAPSTAHCVIGRVNSMGAYSLAIVSRLKEARPIPLYDSPPMAFFFFMRRTMVPIFTCVIIL
jgi:hypothetical protein